MKRTRRRNKHHIKLVMSSHHQQLFVLKKGTLTKYNYHTRLNTPTRRQALTCALKHIKPLSLYRKLNAVYILTRKRDKPRARIYHRDANWVKTTAAYVNRKK